MKLFLLLLLCPCVTMGHYVMNKKRESSESSESYSDSLADRMKDDWMKNKDSYRDMDMDRMENKDLMDMTDIEDKEVYLFGYGANWKPFEYINDDGDLVGLNYDIVRFVCKAMKKHCEHTVYQDYGVCWNDMHQSPALNNHWFHACVGLIPTAARALVYNFKGEYAHEPVAYIYVRIKSSIITLDDVKQEAEKFGFRKGFRTDPECLEKYLDRSLVGMVEMYDSAEELEDDLDDDAVDAVLLDESDVPDLELVRKIHTEPIRCAKGGPALGVRKDEAHKFEWFDEGLRKIKSTGDYEWLCTMAKRDGNPNCHEVPDEM